MHTPLALVRFTVGTQSTHYLVVVCSRLCHGCVHWDVEVQMWGGICGPGLHAIYLSKIISLILAMIAVFMVSGFSLNAGFNSLGVIFLVLGVISLACLDFTVRVYGKSERTMALTFYSMATAGIIFTTFSINHYKDIAMNDFLIMISAGLIDGVAMMILIYSLRRIEAYREGAQTGAAA